MDVWDLKFQISVIQLPRKGCKALNFSLMFSYRSFIPSLLQQSSKETTKAIILDQNASTQQRITVLTSQKLHENNLKVILVFLSCLWHKNKLLSVNEMKQQKESLLFLFLFLVHHLTGEANKNILA